MGHKLVIWEGERPADDAAGEQQFQAKAAAYLVNEPVEPTPTIRMFGKALTDIWTADPDDPRWPDSPWKWSDDPYAASGPVIYMNLTLRSERIAVPRIADIAEEFGLVTFDLMFGILRPAPQAKVDAIVSEMWRQFYAMRPPRCACRRPSPRSR